MENVYMSGSSFLALHSSTAEERGEERAQAQAHPCYGLFLF